MKTYDRLRETFDQHYTMQSKKTTYRTTRDKPIVHEIFLSLEEFCTGCTKKMKIATKVFDEDFAVVRTEEKIVKVEVPPGSKDGTEVIFPSAGDKKPGMIPGDVIFVIRERKHPHFIRDEENNLIHKVEIPLRDALTGCNIRIPLLCGESLTLSTDDVVTHGTCKRIPGKGLPRGRGHHGDLLVEFSVVFPGQLTDQQKELISLTLPD